MYMYIGRINTTTFEQNIPHDKLIESDHSGNTSFGRSIFSDMATVYMVIVKIFFTKYSNII